VSFILNSGVLDKEIQFRSLIPGEFAKLNTTSPQRVIAQDTVFPRHCIVVSDVTLNPPNVQRRLVLEKIQLHYTFQGIPVLARIVGVLKGDTCPADIHKRTYSKGELIAGGKNRVLKQKASMLSPLSQLIQAFHAAFSL
jgi:hypothetical protein